ncbi:MAG: chromosome segregation protein SMC, partial [Bacillota bacterium]|nr:chromosome segregation protein SMC [Bacillota bacterium]
SLAEGLMKRKQKLSQDMETSEAELADFDIKSREYRDKLVSVEEELTNGREKYKRILAETGNRMSEEKEVLRKKEETENSLHKAETKRDLLLGFENSYEGYGYAVKFIMGNRSRLRGIYGAAADLIDVPEGLETAVQTALGAGIQNIVCEDDRAASECIKLLKQEKAGRATFLPLNGIRGGRNAAEGKNSEQLRAENGFMGFAVETVKYDSKFKAVMEYLLGRTVIADTLYNAIRMSKKYPLGIRFVTLEGDDVNPSGAITGGKVKNSGPNLFERKNEIKALGTKISELSGEKDRLAIKCGEISADIEKLNAERDNCREYIKRLESDGAEIRKELDISESLRSGVADNARRWKSEAEDIDRELSDTEKMIDDIQKNIDSRLSAIEESEGSMDEQIKDYETEKANADRMLEDINRLKISISSIGADIRHNDENIKRSRAEIARIAEEKDEKERQQEELRLLKKQTEKSIEEDRAELSSARDSYDAGNAEADRIKDERQKAGEKQQEAEARNIELDRLTGEAMNRRHDAELKLAKGESQLEAIKNRLWDSFDVTFPEAQNMKSESFQAGAASRESREIKARMQELEPVNISAIEEYRQVSERYRFMSEQKEDLTAAIDSLKDIISDMDRKINTRFMKSFEEISEEFKRTFVSLFGGGRAELKLENSENVLESTVEIIAQPPGKKLQNISLLSGGEKSLTAIALLCSILKVRPAPFCILDEVEAALDDLNIGRFVDYIKNFENVQFIVVTHQKATMEKSDVMYGITMPEKGVSKVISLKLNS